MASEKKKGSPDAEPMLSVLSDLPVRLAEDGEDGHRLKFKFDGIAKTLAEAAWNPRNRTPLTIVIKAPWGRGKTTLMREIQRQFDVARDAGQKADRRVVDTIWLDVWKYPDEEKIQAGLLGKLLERFRQGSLPEQLVHLIQGKKGHLASLVVRAAAPWAAPGETSYDPVLERRAFLDTFETLFQQLIYLRGNPKAALRDLDGVEIARKLEERQEQHALAVFLDDLDRCSEKRVVETLEAIYSLQNIPGVCFYLGLDMERLLSVLETHLKDRREEFLEKIIQLAYEIPQVSSEGAAEFIDHLLETGGLREILGDAGNDDGIKHLRELTASLDPHPRHLKRFLNDFSLRIGVLRNTNLLEGGHAVGPGYATPKQVLAFHALSWLLPPEERADLRDLKRFGDLFESLRALGDEKPEHISKGAHELRRTQAWIFESIGVTDGRVDELPWVRTLVHFGSPGTVAPVSEEPEPAADVERRIEPRRTGEAPQFVELDGGLFVMGDREISPPEHRVTLTPFAISRFPITNAQYARYVEWRLDQGLDVEAPEHWADVSPPTELLDHPVTHVSWDDARGYCKWLSDQQKQKRRAEFRFDLPTEAQWEFAAGGGEKRRPYPWGSAEPHAELANYGRKVGSTTPVDQYRRGVTAEGVWDLAGNVWEWCLDWYGKYPGAPQPSDPTGPTEGEYRVLRGGSFYSAPRLLRVAWRDLGHPGNRFSGVGFRVVRVAGGQT